MRKERVPGIPFFAELIEQWKLHPPRSYAGIQGVISCCGLNSVTEAILYGEKVLPTWEADIVDGKVTTFFVF